MTDMQVGLMILGALVVIGGFFWVIGLVWEWLFGPDDDIQNWQP